jgi:hypothetical protein
MKNIILLLIILTSANLYATEYSIAFDIKSNYNWRGLKINDTPVFQPSLSVTNNNFTFEVWGNMDLSNNDEQQFEFNETDYTVSYDKEFSYFGITAGLTYYTYPNDKNYNTTEIFAGVSFFTFLEPSIMVYKDIDLYDSLYIQFAISHTFQIMSTGLTISAVGGYSDKSFKQGYFQRKTITTKSPHQYPDSNDFSSGPVDLGLMAELPVKLKKGELIFSISYSNLSDADIHSPEYIDDDSETVYGISYSISF